MKTATVHGVGASVMDEAFRSGDYLGKGAEPI